MNDVLKYIVVVLAPLFVWFVGSTISNINENKKALGDFKLDVAKEYARNEAVNEFRKDLKELSKICHSIAGSLGIKAKGE